MVKRVEKVATEETAQRAGRRGVTGFSVYEVPGAVETGGGLEMAALEATGKLVIKATIYICFRLSQLWTKCWDSGSLKEEAGVVQVVVEALRDNPG